MQCLEFLSDWDFLFLVLFFFFVVVVLIGNVIM